MADTIDAHLTDGTTTSVDVAYELGGGAVIRANDGDKWLIVHMGTCLGLPYAFLTKKIASCCLAEIITTINFEEFIASKADGNGADGMVKINKICRDYGGVVFGPRDPIEENQASKVLQEWITR